MGTVTPLVDGPGCVFVTDGTKFVSFSPSGARLLVLDLGRVAGLVATVATGAAAVVVDNELWCIA